MCVSVWACVCVCVILCVYVYVGLCLCVRVLSVVRHAGYFFISGGDFPICVFLCH